MDSKTLTDEITDNKLPKSINNYACSTEHLKFPQNLNCHKINDNITY